MALHCIYVSINADSTQSETMQTAPCPTVVMENKTKYKSN